MTLLRLPSPSIFAHPSSSHGSPILRLRPRPISIVCASFSVASSSGSSRQIPARDRAIDFGKYWGRMLGTLPSSYLTWVSKNLRAGDYEEWARLADEVLRDPVYRDRLEWESAERVLTGVGLRASSISDSPVEELLDISERFGWDNEDKDGWREIDFQLLGTSKGGRIPRLPNGDGGGRWASGEQKGSRLKGGGRGEVRKDGFLGTASGVMGRREVMGSSSKNAVGFERNNRSGSPRRSRFSSRTDADKNSSIKTSDSSEKPAFSNKDFWVHEAKRPGTLSGGKVKVGYLSKGFRFTVGEEEDGTVEEGVAKETREERRGRRRFKREQQVRTLRREVVGVDAGGGDEAVRKAGVGEDEGGGAYSNPFPGRGALLDKIRGTRRLN